MSVIFDKLKFVQRLESGGGFPRAQAENMSEALHDALAESVATSADIQRLEARVDARMAAVEAKLDIGLAKVDGALATMDGSLAKMDGSLAKVEAALARERVWNVGIGVALFSALAAIRFFGH